MNNPILYIDPNGMENVIYLVGTDGQTRKELKAIQKQINQNFKDMGLKTQAKIFRGNDFSKVFDKMDKHDAVAFIGSAKSVTGAIKSVDKKFSDYLSKDPDFGPKGRINPETSGNPNGDVTNDKIIAVNTEDTKSEAKAFHVSFSEAAAFNVVHGAGHNSGMGHGDEHGVSPSMNYANVPGYSVMSSGNYILSGIMTLGAQKDPLSGYVKTSNNQGVVHDSYVKRFGDSDPVANKNIPVEK